MDYRRVVELSIADNVRFVLSHNMDGLSWTWIVVFRLNEDKVIGVEYPEDISYYMEKIKEVLEIRKIMGVDDNDKWYKELKKRYEVLCEYLANERKD